jgi:hypothetical protein
MRTLKVMALVLALALPVHGYAGQAGKQAVLYKNPQCDCCEDYAKYLEQNGYRVTVKATHDLSVISRNAGVPPELEGCHTMMVGGYVVGGHIPVNVINRLLSEKPKIKGISLPGMPSGSPGMSGPKTGPFTIYAISTGTPTVYAVE